MFNRIFSTLMLLLTLAIMGLFVSAATDFVGIEQNIYNIISARNVITAPVVGMTIATINK